MAVIPLPANILQKHGAWTGTGFVCSDDLPLSDDEDEEQAAFNFICKRFVWNCSFSLVLVLGSLFWLHSRAGTRSHSTGLIWQACRLRQGDKGMQLGFFQHLVYALATSYHLENLWTWVMHTMPERCFWQDVKEASSPSQSGGKAPRKGGRDLGDDILASHCVVAWYETSGSSFGLKQAQASFLQTICRKLTRKMKMRRKLTSSNLVVIDELLESCFISFALLMFWCRCDVGWFSSVFDCAGTKFFEPSIPEACWLWQGPPGTNWKMTLQSNCLKTLWRTCQKPYLRVVAMLHEKACECSQSEVFRSYQ